MILVGLQLEVGTSLSSNGRDRLDATGIAILVRLQLEVDISPSSNGRDIMDAENFIRIHIPYSSLIYRNKRTGLTVHYLI